MKTLLALLIFAGCNFGTLTPTNTMTVEIRGNGTVDADWSGQICSPDCTFVHEAAIVDEDGHDFCMNPEPGWQFSHWEGDCSSLTVEEHDLVGGGTVACIHVYFSGDMNCTAVFAPRPRP